MMKKPYLLPIVFYQRFLSPICWGCCRYTPTCSHYAGTAIHTHGVLKGIYLAARRLLSCHPYSKRDLSDPVPKVFAWRDAFRYNLGKTNITSEKNQL